MSLTASDFQRVWRLSNELFRAGSVEEILDILFGEGRSLFPFDSAVLFPFDPDLATVTNAGHLSRHMGNQDGIAADYAAYYHRLDPLNVLEKPRNHNRALRTLDVIGQSKYRNSEFYRDFSNPLGIETVLGVCAAQRDKPVCGIAFHRGRGVKAFSEADRERLTLLAPSLAYSLDNLRLRESSSLQRFEDGPGVAVWLLEPGSGRVRRNSVAERMACNATDGLSGHPLDGLPARVRSLVDRLLAARPAVRSGAPFAPVAESLSCRSGHLWYSFTVTALPATELAALNVPIVVTAARRSTRHELDERMQSLGLSEREREITRHIVHGLSNKEIAICLDITEQTVKDHLRSIFAKAELNSRTRLVVRMVLGE